MTNVSHEYLLEGSHKAQGEFFFLLESDQILIYLLTAYLTAVPVSETERVPGLGVPGGIAGTEEGAHREFARPSVEIPVVDKIYEKTDGQNAHDAAQNLEENFQ